MSTTYPHLTHTQFPDTIDTINNFVDVTLSTLPLAKEYYRLYNNGDIEGANEILEQNPSLKYSYIGAASLNPIVDSIKAMQMFYMQDVQQYLMNIVQYKGEWSASVKYVKYNTVKYLHKSALETYMCITDTPIGTNPLDTSYWIPLTMRGEKGNPGIGLSNYGIWRSTVAYPPDALVAHKNALWASNVENSGVMPTIYDDTYWYLVIEFSSEYLSYEDQANEKRYQLLVENGNIYMEEL